MTPESVKDLLLGIGRHWTLFHRRSLTQSPYGSTHCSVHHWLLEQLREGMQGPLRGADFVLARRAWRELSASTTKPVVRHHYGRDDGACLQRSILFLLAIVLNHRAPRNLFVIHSVLQFALLVPVGSCRHTDGTGKCYQHRVIALHAKSP